MNGKMKDEWIDIYKVKDLKLHIRLARAIYVFPRFGVSEDWVRI